MTDIQSLWDRPIAWMFSAVFGVLSMIVLTVSHHTAEKDEPCLSEIPPVSLAADQTLTGIVDRYQRGFYRAMQSSPLVVDPIQEFEAMRELDLNWLTARLAVVEAENVSLQTQLENSYRLEHWIEALVDLHGELAETQAHVRDRDPVLHERLNGLQTTVSRELMRTSTDLLEVRELEIDRNVSKRTQEP